ncbi:hypothetical protein KUTeg_012503 [Tegillarca granosa]|uniref:Heme NO-binding domain-containing protein n=1 Tax=Tegillarca granosa TaxID=220873 RepID=A0ABQ9EZR3_TEGGR|nr:hypothetical protein KUTeg_012503 [Tegillarca granosa]
MFLLVEFKTLKCTKRPSGMYKPDSKYYTNTGCIGTSGRYKPDSKYYTNTGCIGPRPSGMYKPDSKYYTNTGCIGPSGRYKPDSKYYTNTGCIGPRPSGMYKPDSKYYTNTGCIGPSGRYKPDSKYYTNTGCIGPRRSEMYNLTKSYNNNTGCIGPSGMYKPDKKWKSNTRCIRPSKMYNLAKKLKERIKYEHYGQLNIIIKNFVEERHGEEKWNKILKRLNLKENLEDPKCRHDDSITQRIIEEMISILGFQREALMTLIGEYFFKYLRKNEYDEMIRNLGIESARVYPEP